MSAITIIPQKKIKGFLKAKRKIQKYSESSVRTIAKNLRIPFAVDRQHAREIITQWKTVLRYPDGSIMRDHKGRPMFSQPKRFALRAARQRFDSTLNLQAA